MNSIKMNIRFFFLFFAALCVLAFRSADAATISGTVSDSITNSGISGASVFAIQSNSVIVSTLTDSSGNYVLNGVAAGTYTLQASKAHYLTKSMEIALKSTQVVTKNLSLQPQPGSISGTITNELTGTPLQSVSVTIFNAGLPVANAKTNGAGVYTVSVLAPGTYSISAKVTNFTTGTESSVVVTSNVTTTVDLQLHPQVGSLTGIVTDAASGEPLTNADISVEILLGSSIIASTHTDSQGLFQITGILVGDYLIKATAEKYQDSYQGVIVSSEENSIVNFAMEVNPGSISGVVRDAKTNDLLDGASIDVFNGSILIHSTMTDTNGIYVITNLATGSYFVRATAPHRQILVHAAFVQSNFTTVLDFSLQDAPGSISGVIVDASNKAPIANVAVDILQNTVVIASVQTDIQGMYAVESVAPGNYLVRVSAANYQNAYVSATVTSNVNTIAEFNLLLQPGTVSGCVKNVVTGDPIMSALVEIYKESTQVSIAVTNASGDYIIPGLAPGNYTVKVSESAHQTALSGLTVTANQNVTLNVPLSTIVQKLSDSDKRVVTSSSISETVLKIIDAFTKLPTSGASVVVEQSNLQVANGLTDAKGNFLISGILPGWYKIKLSLANFQSLTVDAFLDPNVLNVLTLNLVSIPLAPGNLVGELKKDKVLQRKGWFSQLTWKPSTSPGIVGYNIYRKDKLIGTTSDKVLTFIDRDREKDKTYTYTVRAVNSLGVEGAPSTVIVSKS